MQINTCEKYDVESIDLEKPLKKDDIYVSNINFCIQTPKLKINKVSKKLSILVDESMEKLLIDFDNKIISKISEKSEDFFEEFISEEDFEEMYKHSIKTNKLNVTMNLNFNKKINIYNKKKEQLEISDLSEGNIIICLLKCKRIIFYKNHCEPHWEVCQIKLKEISSKKETKETKEEITNKYLFIEDPEDNYEESDNDEDEIKRIKIKN